MIGAADPDTFEGNKRSPTPARQHLPNVLFVNHAGDVAGAELCLLDIVEANAAYSTVLLLANGPFRCLLEKAGVRVEILEVPRAFHRVRRETVLPSLSSLASIPAIVRNLAARARDFDVVYANSQKAFLVASVAARLARRPLIWHLHDILHPQHFSRTNIRLDVSLANYFANRVITVSEAAKRAFVDEGGRPAKVKVVYNGIDPGPFLAVDRAQASEEVRASLGIEEEPLIGCFSRLAHWKGQHVILEALAGLQSVHALFAGGELFSGARHENTLRELARDLGVARRIHFVGQQDNVPRLMQAVDIVVHPSTAPEPFARTVIEGLLAARPLVAAANGGTTEIIEDGQNGLLFEPGNSGDLANAIRRLLENTETAASMAERARIYAIANLSKQAFVAGVYSEIRKAAALSAPSS